MKEMPNSNILHPFCMASHWTLQEYLPHLIPLILLLVVWLSLCISPCWFKSCNVCGHHSMNFQIQNWRIPIPCHPWSGNTEGLLIPLGDTFYHLPSFLQMGEGSTSISSFFSWFSVSASRLNYLMFCLLLLITSPTQAHNKEFKGFLFKSPTVATVNQTMSGSSSQSRHKWNSWQDSVQEI